MLTLILQCKDIIIEVKDFILVGYVGNVHNQIKGKRENQKGFKGERSNR